MKILVYGAGVVGSLYAGMLKEAGHQVTILARGQRLEEIRQHGIVLEDALTSHRMCTRVDVIEELKPDEPYDLVMVIMRKNQVAEILPVLAANHYTPNVLFMVNNAAGPDAWIAALGTERVMLGFPSAGGTREGHVVRYIIASAKEQSTSIGELHGEITPRLKSVAGALVAAGFSVTIRENMDAWLKTHAALVSPVANAIYMAGGDIYRLTRTRDALVLLVRAVKEGFHVLQELSIPITPAKFKQLLWIPEPVLVAFLKKAFNNERAELALQQHANAARDEMKQLADEFQALARLTSLPTPAIDQLYAYVDTERPPAPEGSANLRLDWRGLLVPLAALIGLLVGVLTLRRGHKRG